MELLKTNQKLIFTVPPSGSCVRPYEAYIVEKIENSLIWFKNCKTGQRTLDALAAVKDAEWINVKY